MTDRELDAMVAEKIMGLSVIAHDWPIGLDPECGCPDAAMEQDDPHFWHTERGPVYLTVPDLPSSVMPVPCYSADISEAWEVLNKLRSSGDYCCITVRSDYDYVWDVWLTRAGGESHEPSIKEVGVFLPKTICLAALAAVGVETE